jgi:carbamoyltransferase
MKATILGISAFYHDAAAAIIKDGEIVAAAHEERFSRIRHDPRFPRNAINYCLEEAFLEASDLDAIVFYDSPVLTLDRVVRSCLHFGALGRDQFQRAVHSVLSTKMFVEDHVHLALGTLGRAGRILYTEHHFAHAASAFYPSPFKEAAIITLDGVGEWTTTAIGFGESEHLELVEELHYPHSLGLLYSAFTSFCGFRVNSGEYKLMGLAAYGEPRYAKIIREHLIDVRSDGSYRLNLDYFAFPTANAMTNERFHGLFGGPPRVPESRITNREADLAASIQQITNETVLAVARRARSITGSRNVTLAGGVALNCVAIGELSRSAIFDRIWIQPAAGDAGGCLGAALLVAHTHFGVPRALNSKGRDNQRGSYLGPSFASGEISAFLDRQSFPYHRVMDSKERARIVAKALAEGKVVGLFSGRMEFGPRALGARSILADPRDKSMQKILNQKIKRRESFRPFAPAVLAEEAADYFDLSIESPYMLIATALKQKHRLVEASTTEGEDDPLKTLHVSRSTIPAVTHVDYSARVQTVSESDHPELYNILLEFRRHTGIGVLVNTSFNVRGEPIVCSPKDAYVCFMQTDIDLLVLEDMLLWKEKQPSLSRSDNSTVAAVKRNSDARSEDGLAAFFSSTALAAADRLRIRRRKLLVDAPDPSAQTYWKPRQPESRYEAPGARTPDELAQQLSTLWIQNDLVELSDLAAGLAHFAGKFRNTVERDPEVAPFLYAMF